MSNISPTKPYVYQPRPPDGSPDPRIYAIAGLGAEKFQGKLFTKEEARKAIEGDG